MEPSAGRSEIEGLAERIDAFAAGLADHERDLLGYMLDAARASTVKRGADDGDETYSSPVAKVLASVLDGTTLTSGFSIRFFPWIRHGSPDFGDVVVKPSG